MLTPTTRLPRALAATRRAAATGRGDQCVPVRRWHLREVLDHYERVTAAVRAWQQTDPGDDEAWGRALARVANEADR